jgi:hypothetical protein
MTMKNCESGSPLTIDAGERADYGSPAGSYHELKRPPWLGLVYYPAAGGWRPGFFMPRPDPDPTRPRPGPKITRPDPDPDLARK